MAKIVITNFLVEPDGTQQKATVEGHIKFSQTEIDLNLRFWVKAYLYEIDDAVDIFELGPYMTTNVIPRGNRDDYAGPIDSTSIRPNGQNQQQFSFVRSWNFPSKALEQGLEEFRAVVRAIPDIRGHIAISNEYSVDLEGDVVK